MNLPLNVWRDTSSRDQSGRCYSESYEYQTKNLRLSIHRHRDYPPDQWFVSCYEVGANRLQLQPKALDDVQGEARKMIAERLLKLHAELVAPAKDGSEPR